MGIPFADKLTHAHWQKHPQKVHWPIGAARVGAEVGSLLFATQIVPLIQTVAPGTYDETKEELSRLIEPHLGWFRKHVTSLPAFAHVEPAIEKAASDHEKAKLVAGTLLDFGMQTSAGMIGQIASQGLLMKAVGLPDLHNPGSGFLRAQWEHTKRLAVPLAIDQVTNVALVGVMQGVCPETTKSASDSTADLLQKTLGIRPEATRYFLQWTIPKLAGMGASTFLLNDAYRRHLSDPALAAAR